MNPSPGYVSERILEALFEYPCALTMDDLICKVYNLVEPPFAPGCIYTKIGRLNNKWLPKHLPLLRIVNRGGYIRLLLRRHSEAR